MNKFLVGCLVIGSWCLTGTALAGVSSELPHVTKKMTHAAFWIERTPEPDKPILSPEQLSLLNRQALSLEPSAVDVAVLAETLPGSELRRRIQDDLKPFRNRSFYTWDPSGENVLFGTIELELLKERMRLKEIPEKIPVRFGLVVRDCDLRSLPVGEGIFEEKDDREFDLAQQTRLSVATPVAVLWESEGGEWFYLVSSLLEGWVAKGSVGFFPTQAALTAYLDRPFVVVTVPLVKVEGVPGGTALPMGTILHGYQKRDALYFVEYPVWGKGGTLSFRTVTVPASSGIHGGFLPFTKANVLRQALQLEGMPYGWGGLNGGYDCSGFLHDLFLTMGVLLPRNSGPQSKAGRILAEFKPETEKRIKQNLLASAPPVTTFIHLDGHIMLYLGKVNKRYYVLHATSGYQDKRLFRNTNYRLMSVVVSDLSLGEGGRKGALLKRMLSVNALTDERRP